MLYSQIVEAKTCRQNGRNESKGEKSYLLWRHFLPFSLRWTICQQFIAKIHEHSRAYHISSSHVRISGRKCYYKKKPVKHISGILESKWFEIRIDNNYPVFFSCRRMLAWHWKENRYNHIYIKKKDAAESEIHISTWIKGICIRFVRVFWSIQFNHMTTDR